MPSVSTTQVASAPRSARFDVEGAAAYVGVSVSFMNKARLTGNGPAYLKLGARVLYETAELDAWLASRRRTSTSAMGAA